MNVKQLLVAGIILLVAACSGGGDNEPDSVELLPDTDPSFRAASPVAAGTSLSDAGAMPFEQKLLISSFEENAFVRSSRLLTNVDFSRGRTGTSLEIETSRFGTFRQSPSSTVSDANVYLLNSESSRGRIVGGAVALDYSMIGSWLLSDDSNTVGVGAAGHAGLRRPPADMPGDRVVTYVGDALGFISDRNGAPKTPDLVAGVVVLNADFRGGSVTGLVDRLEGYDSDGSSYDLNQIELSGSISKARFSGRAEAQPSISRDAFSTGVSGPLNGQFCGPAAEEVGGVLTMEERGRQMVLSIGAR
ncbi:MAG: transferrin-binding protein-like solute binding protein [Pseudomonadota bacterium]